MNVVPIYFLIIIAFFGQSLEEYHLLPPVINWLTEPIIYFYFLLGVITKRRKTILPFLPLILLFLIVAFSSAVFNGRVDLGLIYSLRLTIRFYLLFLAMVNLGFNDYQLKNINNFFFYIFVLQIPVAFVKLFIYGQGERAIGTYALHGGTMSTVLPLIAIGYLIGCYFYYNSSKSYIILTIGFIAFAIIGKKRAFVFYMPALMLFTMFMIWHDKFFTGIQINKVRRQMLLVGGGLLIFITITALKFIPYLNPEHKVGGDIDFGYALQHARNYTTQQSSVDPRYTGGRWSTTKQVFSTLSDKGFIKLFFGYGPGSWTKSRFGREENIYEGAEDLTIVYGLTSLTYLVLEYGLSGCIIYLIFIVLLFKKCLLYWKNTDDPYWKAFSFGSLSFAFTNIMITCSYNMDIAAGDLYPLIYYYCMATVIININKKLLTT